MIVVEGHSCSRCTVIPATCMEQYDCNLDREVIKLYYNVL